MLSATDALQELIAGHRRFRTSLESEDGLLRTRDDRILPGPQEPFAAILCCADSRVPPELVFDQDLGDLFVVRVAGNVVTPTQLGSLEFAAGPLGTRLIVVLGHSECGAVIAAVTDTLPDSPELTPGLRSLVDEILPALEEVKAELPPDAGLAEKVEKTVQANVRASVRALAQSELLRAAMDDGLRIVGAEYDLGSGCVRFLDVPVDLQPLVEGAGASPRPAP